MNGEIQKILVRAPNWIGDSVVSIALIRTLINKGFEVHVASKPLHRPLFAGIKRLGGLIEIAESRSKLTSIIKRGSQYRAEGFDAALILPLSFSSALEVFLSSIPVRIAHSYDSRSLLLTHPVRLSGRRDGSTVFDDMIRLLEPLGIDSSDVVVDFSIPLSDKAVEEAKRILQQTEHPLFGVNPSAAYGITKRWMPERFAEVLQTLLEKTDGWGIIFGGPGDGPICEKVFGSIRKALKDRVLPLYADRYVTLQVLAAMAKHIDLFVTNDTGPMHVVAAQGTGCVVIFGATSASYQYPYSTGARLIEAEGLLCRPCYRKRCRYSLECLTEIDVHRVIDACMSLLERKLK